MSTTALLLCLVVGVHDGDTLTVRCGQSDQMKIRLSQIDAPELRQPYGAASKRALSDMVYGKTIELRPLKKDRYGRTVGEIVESGHDIQWEMIKRGWAHCYVQYVTDDACYGYQDQAREAHRGLWADPHPVNPWEWRHKPKGS